MTDADLAATIDAAWEDRERLSASIRGAYRDAVEAALDGLDGGKLRVAEKTANGWQVRQWLKKAVLLSFRLNEMSAIPGGPGQAGSDRSPNVSNTKAVAGRQSLFPAEPIARQTGRR